MVSHTAAESPRARRRKFSSVAEFYLKEGAIVTTVIGMKHEVERIEREHGGRTEESRRLRRKKIELEIEELLAEGKVREAEKLKAEL
jgi:hypothetical protein